MRAAVVVSRSFHRRQAFGQATERVAVVKGRLFVGQPFEVDRPTG
jgi:hypothetical protein